MKTVAVLIWISFEIVATKYWPCDDWKKLGDYCYRRSCTFGTFSEAQTHCTEQDGDLPSISTEEEYLHVASILQGKHPVLGWIGLTRRSGTWKWTDGTRIDTSEFTPKYLNKWAKKGNCVYMKTTPSGMKRLFGESCTKRLDFVCRKKSC
ncbi:hypothetical protein Y032_0006g3008 [Ancylostoma ceylanicum]|uniref:C-type lectin domain-containing protein n=1 Tax=Ancylostoma ceylanicum TaxID=53326 RepID=A0A016VRW2_9BILA|nr:hypothetical protein Y032_0006g3008 [Ancylostoma ceylanicum]